MMHEIMWVGRIVSWAGKIRSFVYNKAYGEQNKRRIRISINRIKGNCGFFVTNAKRVGFIDNKNCPANEIEDIYDEAVAAFGDKIQLQLDLVRDANRRFEAWRFPKMPNTLKLDLNRPKGPFEVVIKEMEDFSVTPTPD